MATLNSFGTRTRSASAARSVQNYSLPALEKAGSGVSRLPYSMKRSCSRTCCGGRTTRSSKPTTFARWRSGTQRQRRRGDPFMPARVLLQDFTGVPASSNSRPARTRLIDSAAIRSGQPAAAVELVIDHSVQVDYFGRSRTRSRSTPASSSRAIASATLSCAWGQRRSTTFKVE